LIYSQSVSGATGIIDSLAPAKSAIASGSVAFGDSPLVDGSEDIPISSSAEPSNDLRESCVVIGSYSFGFSLVLLSSTEPSDCSSSKALSYAASSAAIRTPTVSEEAVVWFDSYANGDAAAAQNSGAVGSGLIAGTVVSVVAVIVVVAGLLFLFLLRLKRKGAVPVNVEDNELGESGVTFEEWSDVISEVNVNVAENMEESLTIFKPP
jgi:uncharacterized membrane protein (Fun14 family)